MRSRLKSFTEDETQFSYLDEGQDLRGWTEDPALTTVSSTIPDTASPGEASAAGPDAAARKTGGGSGGSTGGSGGSGSGGTTTPPSSSATFNTVTVRWDPLNPPSGDTSTPTDSYFTQQWGLTNATAGIDVVKAWQNYSGAGVKVGVVDDGFDYNHPDIKPNYQVALDYDARTGTNDAFGDPTADKHGTTVMGVIGAARDGSGVVGVAYHAGGAGFRIGFGSSGSTSQIADAFNHLLSSGMDVANNSWQYTTAYSDNFNLSGFASIKSAMTADVANGRGGLGIDFVFAAGNNRDSGDNVNYHNLQNNPYAITVAATDTYGHITSYSSPGAALLVSAPGKAYTDDRAGSYGYNGGDYINISGTSYAAPYVSGVVALMLQANPDLGYRDVMEILAYSARNSDTASLSWQTNGAHDWNGGGLHFSQDYGFGMVDAWAAVRLAESWQKQSTYADMSNVTVVHSDNLAIADSGSVSSTISETYDLWLDKVLVDLNISHGSPHDLTVTLTSPSGTTAVLVDHPANGTGSGIVFEASANTFWGENAKGDWTLTVTDSVAGNSGTLNGWTLLALGDAPTTPTVYVYTDEFAAASGAARGILNDASGSAGINTAAVSTGSWLDLNAGAQDTVAGRALQIGSGTILKSAWGGDGNDTIVANGAGDLIEAGRGNDTVTAGTGGDRIWGGARERHIRVQGPPRRERNDRRFCAGRRHHRFPPAPGGGRLPRHRCGCGRMGRPGRRQQRQRHEHRNRCPHGAGGAAGGRCRRRFAGPIAQGRRPSRGVRTATKNPRQSPAAGRFEGGPLVAHDPFRCD